jgi:hypothetical protein
MHRAFRSLVAMLAAFFCFQACATPQRYNGTELWINTSESGWGMYLAHQGDTLFATLFVYGADGQPRWYSASGLTGDGTYSGALYESSGTPWGMPFDASTVTRRQVGTMTVQLRGDNATLTYDVDGVRVSKEVVPFTFKFIWLGGSYYGYMTQPSSAPGGAVSDEVHINISHTATSFTMTTLGSVSGSCTYDGKPAQHGSLVDVTGNYSCGDGRAGNFTLTDADLTTDGFTARFAGARVTDAAAGRIEGVHLDAGSLGWNGWMSDLWLAPGESGWGLNLVGQGEDNMFGTLFIYDENRRAKWYSMSDLHYIGRDRDSANRGTYIGTITESTGPWFGMASFDANAVTRRVPGSVSIKFLDNRHAEVRIQFGLTEWKKSMEPYALRMNDLSGTYQGHIVTVMTANTTAAAPMTLNINDNGRDVVISSVMTGNTCTYTGSRSQYGQRVGIAGTWTCNGNGSTGTFTISDAEVTANGFTAAMTGMPGGLTNPVGHIGGARIN